MPPRGYSSESIVINTTRRQDHFPLDGAPEGNNSLDKKPATYLLPTHPDYWNNSQSKVSSSRKKRGGFSRPIVGDADRHHQTPSGGGGGEWGPSRRSCNSAQYAQQRSTQSQQCPAKIMSLHHHQFQQQQPPSASTPASTTASASAVPRSSSSSPQHTTQPQRHTVTTTICATHYSIQQQQQQQQQHRHLPFVHQPPHSLPHHQHRLPPRPPSTTSSGSLSTGFPDDLQDDAPLETQSASSQVFAFHPPHHHQLQYHRHTSPHFPPQHHLIHHLHHHFVPPPPPVQPSAGGGHHSALASSPGDVAVSVAGSSRAASRATFDGEGDGTGDEDNLLLDNTVGVQDAVYLDPVTTDNFLTNIVQRFKRDFIYTYVGEGTLLMSVNPYKPLSIFSPRVKAAYRNISNPFQLPPHIYGQLCLILQRNTSSLERTQTLLLTGESGSGKSTNLSYLLDFLVTKQESRSRRNSGRCSSSRGYYPSTGSLHRQQQYLQQPQHSTTCPYSGTCSGRASSLSLSAGAPSASTTATVVHNLEENVALRVLQGNFLLNAFGNCKTSKNSDASRFGKLVQLQIDFLGNVCGGRVLSYQLEKWRVQGPNSGGVAAGSGGGAASSGEPSFERNFHIFYILLVGADSSTLKSLRLTRNLETYAMLNVKNHSSFLNASQSHPSTPFCPHDHYYHLKGFKHGYEGCFQLVKTTLASILSSSSSSSITPDHVFRMLAAILKLNNLVFAPVANIDGTEGCDVTNEQDIQDIAHLLSIVRPELPSQGGQSFSTPPLTPSNGNNSNHNYQHPLKMILTTRKISRSDGTTAHVELTASESSSLRNSLTVTLYTRLFSWLTKQVAFNQKSVAASSTKTNLLNLVDFYGFEVLPTNSIEQFLINFTNEKIQYVLADLRLRLLQEEFVKDGLEWITIDTAGATAASSGNSISTSNPAGKLIDLVEENCHGLLSIFSNCANDHELERQFAKRFGEKESSGAAAQSKGTTNSLVEYLQQSFRLRHWAGPVIYSTRHFASKNRDTLPPHLPHQLYTWTSDPLLRVLFCHDGRTSTPIDSGKLLATSNMELSLKNLFQKCNFKHIYYIRCLKPNELSQPEVCELPLLKHQVKYHRLIDFVRVYREGFCYNLGAFEFLERYKLLSLNTWPNWRVGSDVRLGIQVLMKDLQMKEGLDYCFGGGMGCSGDNWKVYLKGQRIASELEDFRRERLDDLALLIQKTYKGYKDWHRFTRMKDAHRVICRAWRNYLCCKRKEQRKLWKTMKHSVKVIQQHYILWKRRLFLRQLILQVRTELQQLAASVGSQQQQSVQVGGGMTGGVGVTLPSRGSMLSPISRDWPYSPSYLEEASFQLRRVFHRWRCRLYRSKFNEIERAKMAEKVTASLLFKEKKTSYSRSVSHPFLGDYIRLRQNSQWKRTTTMMMLQTASHLQSQPQQGPLQQQLSAEENPDGGEEPGKKPLLPSQPIQIVFADLINKITRSSGKFLPIVLVVTTTQIMILDPRTLNIKYKIPATEVWRLSVSPYGDDICVLHLQQPMRVQVGSVMGPGEQGNLFQGGVLSDDDDPYYQFADEPSPTTGGNFGTGGCVCSSSNTQAFSGSAYYHPEQSQHQCQPGSGGCGLFGGSSGDNDSGQYLTSDVVKLTKGDLVLHTSHLIEMVTKIYLIVKNATGRGPEVIISNEFPAVFNNQRVQLCFRYSKPLRQSSKQEPTTSSGGANTTSTTEPANTEQQRAQPLSPPSVLPDGPIPPLPPSALGSREEPVIPPSQIKITRKKSTRMEFLIGHSS